MGGKTFDGLSRRHTTAELNIKMAEVIELLKVFFSDFAQPLFLKNKKDHGDLDLIVAINEGRRPALESFISQSYNDYKFSEREISFLHGDLHVDLIIINKKWIDSAVNYFSYGDLGNLLGMLARSVGYRLSEQGIFETLKAEDCAPMARNYITHNWDESLELLGFSRTHIKKFTNGFSDAIDMFNFIKSSKLYDKQIFKLENMNSAQRRRFKKRPNQKLFLEHL
ncbi:hypothetical protein [Photobacterium kishitanii]|uniref:Uncharacterized protein n=1 Tax=Photobacterium kishitanii TaxID=318456 RepID=A0A2T3KLL4_9GAMM|nr:hypothetical protein [Photobacterium kishitanii]PSV00615.1 hypothetical protein C9J27_05620 [Photobacterium kishitanii]